MSDFLARRDIFLSLLFIGLGSFFGLMAMLTGEDFRILDLSTFCYLLGSLTVLSFSIDRRSE